MSLALVLQIEMFLRHTIYSIRSKENILHVSTELGKHLCNDGVTVTQIAVNTQGQGVVIFSNKTEIVLYFLINQTGVKSI